jgi:hypothetical protein
MGREVVSMPEPSLTVEAGPGVQRVVVHFDCGDHEGGLRLLERAFPVLHELDRVTRQKDHGAHAVNKT